MRFFVLFAAVMKNLTDIQHRMVPRTAAGTSVAYTVTDARYVCNSYVTSSVIVLCNRLSWLTVSFWATVCKTVRPMLLDRCPVCLSRLSVTLVYCGQVVGWIKIKLGIQVGLGPGHMALHGT